MSRRRPDLDDLANEFRYTDSLVRSRRRRRVHETTGQDLAMRALFLIIAACFIWLALVIVGVASSRADIPYVHPVEYVQGDLVSRSLVASQLYWDTDLSCVTFVWEDGDDTYGASADPEGCRIYLNRTVWLKQTKQRRCETIVHEYGHLLGHTHTTTGNIMDPLRDDGQITECKQLRKGIATTFERRTRKQSTLTRRKKWNS